MPPASILPVATVPVLCDGQSHSEIVSASVDWRPGVRIIARAPALLGTTRLGVHRSQVRQGCVAPLSLQLRRWAIGLVRGAEEVAYLAPILDLYSSSYVARTVWYHSAREATRGSHSFRFRLVKLGRFWTRVRRRLDPGKFGFLETRLTNLAWAAGLGDLV